MRPMPGAPPSGGGAPGHAAKVPANVYFGYAPQEKLEGEILAASVLQFARRR
jgi:hypothetical protein